MVVLLAVVVIIAVMASTLYRRWRPSTKLTGKDSIVLADFTSELRAASHTSRVALLCVLMAFLPILPGTDLPVPQVTLPFFR